MPEPQRGETFGGPMVSYPQAEGDALESLAMAVREWVDLCDRRMTLPLSEQMGNPMYASVASAERAMRTALDHLVEVRRG